MCGTSNGFIFFIVISFNVSRGNNTLVTDIHLCIYFAFPAYAASRAQIAHKSHEISGLIWRDTISCLGAHTTNFTRSFQVHCRGSSSADNFQRLISASLSDVELSQFIFTPAIFLLFILLRKFSFWLFSLDVCCGAREGAKVSHGHDSFALCRRIFMRTHIRVLLIFNFYFLSSSTPQRDRVSNTTVKSHACLVLESEHAGSTK